MAYKKPVPTLRPEAILEVKSSIELNILRVFKNNYPFQNCLNCKNWDFGRDLCGKFNTRPPTDIIVYSCPEYDNYSMSDDIPF